MTKGFWDSSFVRAVMVRRRLFLSVVAGTVLALVLPLPAEWRWSNRLLIGWDLAAAFYITGTARLIYTSTIDDCHRRAKAYDDGDKVILLLVCLSAVASLAAIFGELGAVRAGGRTGAIALTLTGATVVLSWTFTHLVFTMHYASLYYRPTKGAPAGGLEFAGDRDPDYHDFLYYAFVVACTAQTADVNTTTQPMRRLTMTHGIISFVFNTAILALMINIGAGLTS